jgi:hypothetical protein
MADLYDKFCQAAQYARHQNIPGEAVTRLPYALFAPAIVTHFPLFDRSEEVHLFESGSTISNFEHRRRQIEKFLISPIDTHFPDSKFQHLIPPISAESQLARQTIQEALKNTWTQCKDTLAQLFNTMPQLLILNAKTLINLELNRRVHDAIAFAVFSNSKPWNEKYLKENAFRHTNDILFLFLKELDVELNAMATRELDQPETPTVAHTTTERPDMGLGGLILPVQRCQRVRSEAKWNIWR